MSLFPWNSRTGKRQGKTFWKEIRKLLLEVCDRNILTSTITTSQNLLNASQENLLDKWVQKLVECLPSLSGKKENAVIKKPQCFRLQLLGCLAELENDPSEVSSELRNGDTVW